MKRRTCRMCREQGIVCQCILGNAVFLGRTAGQEEITSWRWTPGVYFIGGETPKGTLIKVGVTEDLGNRFRGLVNSSPIELSLLAYHPCKSRKAAEQLERDYHKRLLTTRSHGEWFFDSDLIRSLVATSISALNAPKKPFEEGWWIV